MKKFSIISDEAIIKKYTIEFEENKKIETILSEFQLGSDAIVFVIMDNQVNLCKNGRALFYTQGKGDLLDCAVTIKEIDLYEIIPSVAYCLVAFAEDKDK